MLTELLSSDFRIDVVGTATDPIAAREKIKPLNPDVLTLHVEMLKMDDIFFLSNLMRLRPKSVVMLSSANKKVLIRLPADTPGVVMTKYFLC